MTDTTDMIPEHIRQLPALVRAACDYIRVCRKGGLGDSSHAIWEHACEVIQHAAYSLTCYDLPVEIPDDIRRDVQRFLDQ